MCSPTPFVLKLALVTIAAICDLPSSFFIEFTTPISTFIVGCEVVECGAMKNLKVIDLTGAGDLFAAGFLHGVVNKLSLKESLKKGTEMSSKIIQQIGARL